MEAPTDPNALRIIVQNLSFGTTQDDLAAFFRTYVGSHDEVTDVLVAVEPSGRSKGFGFVTFATNASVQRAVADGALELDGRTLRVQVANARKEGGSDRRAARAPREVKATGPKLYCGDLPWELSASELSEYFEQWGTVEDAYLAEVQFAAPVNGYKPHRGFGFVIYSSEAEATKALQVSKHTIKGAAVRVTSAKGEPTERKNRGPRKSEGGDGEGTPKKEGERRERKPREDGEKKSAKNDEQRKPREEGDKKGPKGEDKGERKPRAAPAGGAAPSNASPAKKAPQSNTTTSPAKKVIRVAPAPKSNPWNKKGAEGEGRSPDAEAFPTLADVASGKVKPKPKEDDSVPADAPAADASDKGKEEASQ